MKKTKLFKHILACTLVLSLTASDIVPAMAAEVQPSENVEAEITTPEETTGAEETATEGTETAESAEGETYNEPAAQAEGDGESSTAENPAIDNFTVTSPYRGQWTLSYSTSNCTKVDLVVKDSAGKEVYTRTYNISADSSQTQSIYWDEVDSIAAGTYTFTLTPKKAGEDGSDVSGEAKEQTADVTAPSVSNVNASVSSNGDTGFYFLVSYSGDAEYYRVVVTNAAGVQVANTTSYGSGSSSVWVNEALVSGARYTVTVTPNDDYVQGTPQSYLYTAPAVPAITGLAVKEMTQSGFVFTHSALSEGADIEYQYSENAAFNPELAKVGYSYGDALSYSRLEPGVKYFVRACMVMSGVKGAYSTVVNVTAPVAEVTGIGTEINDTDVTLTMSTGYGKYTGFEVYRKSGKKYQKLATTSSRIFTDTGLKKDTKYSYRVRAIYYNINTKKTYYSDDYAYVTVETGKASLNLKASAAGKTSIKLTWSKVAGASGYDVYRYTGDSSSSTYKSGEDYDFSKYELVKSLSKKKKSYTDKKLTSGETYSYTVKAYKTVKGKKKYFTESFASAATKFSFNTTVNVYKRAQNPKNGTVAIAWKQIPQAQGYLIEKYDSTKSEWVQQAKLTKASKTTYTLPASPAGKTINYRVRAYKGNKYTYDSGYEYDDYDYDYDYNYRNRVSVTGSIAVVTGVTATATAEGVRVSWKAVPGASYYRVFRTTDSSYLYDADLKAYDYNNSREVEPEVYVQADAAVHEYCTIGKSNIKMRKAYYNDDVAAAATAKRALRYQYPADYDGNGDVQYWDSASNTYIKLGGIAGTSVIDYNYSEHEEELNPDGVTIKKDNVTLCGPQEGVPYYYYVVAYSVVRDTTVTTSVSYVTASSYGSSKSATAAFAGAVSVKAPTVKVKAGKKSATLTISKVAGAKSYAIYRSTKQKGTYELVGITSKTKYKDSKLTSKKKYYYKVKAIGVNAMGTDAVSGFSKVKNVKVK